MLEILELQIYIFVKDRSTYAHLGSGVAQSAQK